MVWRTAALVLLLFWSIYCVGCEVKGESFPWGSRLEMATTVTFEPVDIGRTTRSQLLVENSGRNAVTIRSIAIQQPAGRDNGVFAVEQSNENLIQPGELAVISFTYTSEGYGGPRGRAWLATDIGGYVVDLLATQPTARLEWSPYPVQFGRVLAGECDTIDVLLQNAGNVVMDIEKLQFPDHNSVFSLSQATFDALPRRMGVAGDGSNSDTWPITVEYCPAEANGAAVNLLVGWFHSDRKEEATQIPLSANGSAPCLAISPVDDAFSFGEVTVNTTADEVFTLTNCASGASAEPLFIDDIAFVDPVGVGLSDRLSLSDLPDFPAEIAPGESTFFVLSYTPTQAGITDRTTLMIDSNDQRRNPLNIEVSGTGLDNACPVATMGCTIRGGAGLPADEVEARPLDVLDCTGGDSSDPDGTVAALEWTIEAAPDGSTSSATGADSTEFSLVLDVQGEYTIQLDAIDNEGRRACIPATTRVSAVYVEGLSAELVWDVPGDPDPTDEGEGSGGDLELHVLNASNGCWGNPDWDCSVDNPSLNWGVPLSPLDDATVKVADSSTGGPENITIDTPADGSYRVGVLYQNDHGFGPADATLRVFAAGVLILEQTRRLTATGEFWDVGVVTVPGLETAVQDEVWPSLADAPCP